MPATKTSLTCAVFAALAIVAGSSGCTEINPLYCQQDTECASFSCNIDARECNPVQECASSASCTSPTAPICDIDLGYCVPCSTPGASTECEGHDPNRGFCAEGRCVECIADSACGIDAPICDDADNECRGCDIANECTDLNAGTDICAPTGECFACLNHSDCSATSGVCDQATHACAETTDVFYVDSTGTDVGTCGASTDPCQTIEFALALASGKRFMLVAAGNYAGNITLTGQDVNIVGPGVSFVALAVDEPALRVSSGATLTIDGMTIRGANGGSNATGIHCRDASTTLTLLDVQVTQNAAHGIDSVGCTVSIVGGSVDGNLGLGMTVVNGVLRIDGAELYGNDDGGMHLLSVQYDITNTYFVENGNTGAGGSDIGGIRVDNTTEVGPQRLAFNTIAGNRARDGASSAGVHCDTAGMAMPIISSNIVYGNVGGMEPVNGNCPWRFSNIEGFDGVDGDNNIDEDPRFEDVVERDYHVRSGSPCIDAGEQLDDVVFDFDQDIRPSKGGHDIGADEIE